MGVVCAHVVIPHGGLGTDGGWVIKVRVKESHHPTRWAWNALVPKTKHPAMFWSPSHTVGLELARTIFLYKI